jgi:hypothetical protein
LLVRCLYASRARAPRDAAVLSSILAQSRRNNAATGVTGLLCVAGDLFIQVLEGGRDEVSELYNRIVRDERHAGVRLLLYQEIAHRRFAQWSMGAVDVAGVNAGLLLKYFRRPQLDPFDSSGEATLALLSELVESGAIASRSDPG